MNAKYLLALVFLLVASGCATKKVTLEPSHNTKVMAITALSDLSENFHMAEQDRDQSRYWYIVESDPVWVMPYIHEFMSRKGLHVSEGNFEELRLAQSSKIFVPLEYGFHFNGEEWVAIFNVKYPDRDVFMSRAYGEKRPLTSTMRMVKSKDTLWTTPAVD